MFEWKLKHVFRRSYGFRSVGVLRLLLVWNKVEKLEWLSSIFSTSSKSFKKNVADGSDAVHSGQDGGVVVGVRSCFPSCFRSWRFWQRLFYVLNAALRVLNLSFSLHYFVVSVQNKRISGPFQNVLLWLCVTRNNLKGLFCSTRFSIQTVVMSALSKCPKSCRFCPKCSARKLPFSSKA